MPLYRLTAVNDILAAIARIERYLDGATDESFQTDALRQDAVIRCLEVISEASRRVPDAYKNGYPHIPWREIAGIGNILRHEYQRVSISMIWNIASTGLFELKDAAVGIQKALNQASQDQSTN